MTNLAAKFVRGNMYDNAGAKRARGEGGHNGSACNVHGRMRVLAKSTDPGRAVLIEKYIDAYLTTETVSVWRALRSSAQLSATSMLNGGRARVGA